MAISSPTKLSPTQPINPLYSLVRIAPYRCETWQALPGAVDLCLAHFSNALAKTG
jgi:hypothetical protein